MQSCCLRSEPRNFQHFIAETDFSAHGIEYLNLAVSDAPGELIFRAFERHKECISQRGSILSNLETEDIADAVVPAVSLDGFFADSMPRKPSILIDVEGASRQVLVGAQELLRRAVSVYIEVEDETRWQGQWLTPDVIRFLETFGLREIGRDCQYGRQYNILFARS